MSYYFPIGAAEGLVTQSISYASLAISASAAVTASIPVVTAIYAPTSGSVPPNGTNGTNRVEADCTLTAPKGDKGTSGAQGQKGDDNLNCPAGTIECTALFQSLSAGYNDGTTRGINYYVPSGSQYSKVCMEIPTGCTVGVNVICPPYLPVAFPSILPNP